MPNLVARPFFLLALLLVTGCGSLESSREEDRPYLAKARQADRWLKAVAVEVDGGRAWPADPDDPGSLPTDLYYGSAGIVLFYLELYQATGDPAALAEAEAGARYLIASLPGALERPEQAGLYTGVAGEGFVLEELHRATGNPGYRRAARRCVELLERSARPAGDGVEWGGTTDIIGGGAGTGLFLLYAARQMGEPEALDLAARAGRRLLQLGIPEKTGLKWRMDPGFPRLMPNFSHGTAGVCYFLATLAAETGDATFLEGALAGARYLGNIADAQGRIFHHEPGGEELFYQGWCHGPAGTGRLHLRLWEATRDDRWRRALFSAAETIMASGIPEKRTPGFWDNVSQCCGSAGVAEFFTCLHRLTGRRDYLDFAKRMADDLVARATPEGAGWKWVQAEHRVKPELVIAQTGLLQGAAGIGLCFLHLDLAERGGGPGIALPDSPFRR